MRLHARQVPEKEVRSREKALMLFGADMRRNSQGLNASAKKYPRIRLWFGELLAYVQNALRHYP